MTARVWPPRSEAFAEYRGRLVPESAALLDTGETVAAELRAGTFALLGERDGAVLGCVIAKPQGDDLYFGRLSVLPAARGQGIARLLIDAVQAEAAQRGLSGVRLNVRIALPENRQLFSALGYELIGRAAHPGFDAPTFIIMRRALSRGA